MKLTRTIAALGIAAGLTAGCQAKTPSTAPTDQPTAPSVQMTAPPTTDTTEAKVVLPPGAKSSDPSQVVAVFARIAAETDCAALQQEFDTAADNHDRDAGTDRGELELRYMNAADKRMDKAGCYK